MSFKDFVDSVLGRFSSNNISDTSSETSHSTSETGCDSSRVESVSESPREVSVFNSFGTSGGEYQSACEASSLTPSSSVTTDTWGSIGSSGSSDYGSNSSSGGGFEW
jgi:hypothetical protein